MATREPERRSPDDILTDAERAELEEWRGHLLRLAAEATAIADSVGKARTIRDAAAVGERMATMGDRFGT